MEIYLSLIVSAPLQVSMRGDYFFRHLRRLGYALVVPVGGTLGQASGREGLEKQYLVMYPLYF